MLATNVAVLEASPHPQTKAVVRAVAPNVPYITTDFIDMRWTDVQADGCTLPFRDSSFGIVLHFHTFEHIPDDRAAMREVARVLMPGGIMLCQVPRREGKPTEEDFSLTAEARQQRYGQWDHVRIYGEDFEERLRECGFAVSSSSAADILDDRELEWHNIKPADRIWSCRPRFGKAPSHPAYLVSNSPETGRQEHEIRALRAALSAQQADGERLRSRKVVRAGLALARPFRPAFTVMRRLGLIRKGTPAD